MLLPYKTQLFKQLAFLGVVGQGGYDALSGVHGLIVEQGNQHGQSFGVVHGLLEGVLELCVANGFGVSVLLEIGSQCGGVWIVGMKDGAVGGMSSQQEYGTCGQLDRGDVDGEVGNRLWVCSEETECVERVEQPSMCLSLWSGEVADAHDGGLQSLVSDGLQNVLFSYRFGLNVRIV